MPTLTAKQAEQRIAELEQEIRDLKRCFDSEGKHHRPNLHGRTYGERLTRVEKTLDALTGRDCEGDGLRHLDFDPTSLTHQQERRY